MKVYRFLYSLGLGLLAVNATHTQQGRLSRGKPIAGRELELAKEQRSAESERLAQDMKFDGSLDAALANPAEWARQFVAIYELPHLDRHYTGEKINQVIANVRQALEDINRTLRSEAALDKGNIDTIIANLKSKKVSASLINNFNALVVEPISKLIDEIVASGTVRAVAAAEEKAKLEAEAKRLANEADAAKKRAEAAATAEEKAKLEAEAKKKADEAAKAAAAASSSGSFISRATGAIVSGAKDVVTAPFRTLARRTEDLTAVTPAVDSARNAARANNNSYSIADANTADYKKYEKLEDALNAYLLASENKVAANDHRLLAVAKLKNELMKTPRNANIDRSVEPLLNRLWQELYGASASLPATAPAKRYDVASSLNNMLPQLNMTAAPATQSVKDKYIALLTNEAVLKASKQPKAGLLASREDKMDSKRGDIARIVLIIANAYKDNKDSRAQAYKQDLWAAGRETINQARRHAGIAQNWDVEELNKQFTSAAEEEAALDAIIDYYILQPQGSIVYAPTSWSTTETAKPDKDANLLQNATDAARHAASAAYEGTSSAASTALAGAKTAASSATDAAKSAASTLSSAASSASSKVSGMLGSSSKGANFTAEQAYARIASEQPEPAEEPAAAVMHVEGSAGEPEAGAGESASDSQIADFVGDWNL